jgi:hypothetical protein
VSPAPPFLPTLSPLPLPVQSGKIVGKGKSFRSFRGAYLSRANRDFLQWNAVTVTELERFVIIPIGHNQYNIMSPAGQFLSAVTDGELMIERRQVGEWEKFTISRVGPGTFSIQTVHGKYISAEPLDKSGRIGACVDKVDDMEKFAIEPLNSSKYSGPRKAFSSRGKYMSAREDGRIVCDRDHHRRWEQFDMTQLGANQYRMQSYMWTKYLTVDGGDVVTASGTTPTDLGVFTVTKGDNGMVNIQTARGKYVVATPSGAIEANHDNEESSVFSVLSPNPPKFAGQGRRLKSCHGDYLSAERDGRLQWNTNWFLALFRDSEKFEFVTLGKSKYHIRTCFKTWLSIDEKAQLYGRQIEEPGKEETFLVKPVTEDGASISIRTYLGHYLSGRENGMTDTTRDSIGELEIFSFF